MASMPMRRCADAPMPGETAFTRDFYKIVAAAQVSLEAAAVAARAAVLTPHILSDSMQGEARDIGSAHAALVRQVVTREQPFKRPCTLISGGETTMTLRGQGRGGRNAEFLLSFAIGIAGLPGVTAIAADTDGLDGWRTTLVPSAPGKVLGC
jgi:hydroxypyruvate reductase